MVEFKNFGQVFETIDKWQTDVARMTEKYCRGVSVAIFRQAIENSVQYSGDFAANWKYNLNTVDTSFTPEALHGRVPHGSLFTPIDDTGDTWQAREISVRNARGKDDAFKLGDIIYISNSAAHDEPYAVGIEQGTIYLRVKDNAHPLERARDRVLRWASDNPIPENREYPVTNVDGYKAATKVTALDSLRRRFKKNA